MPSWPLRDEAYCYCVRADEARARAIRAVVAAQWAVAIACQPWWFGMCGGRDDAVADMMLAALAALPTPEQIVDGDV